VPPAHVALALLVTVIWGLAFVATRVALDDVSPALLTALRFLVAALPVVALPRPTIGWRRLVLIGLTLYTGQFLFQFSGIAAGMPPGLAAIVVQTQALFTIVFAAVAAGERPSPREWTGTAVAFGGLAVIAATVGHDLLGGRHARQGVHDVGAVQRPEGPQRRGVLLVGGQREREDHLALDGARVADGEGVRQHVASG